MKKLLSIFMVVLSTQLAASETGSLIGALQGSDWGDSNDSDVSSSSSTPQFSEDKPQERVCTKGDQTSLPYKVFLNLLQEKNLDVVHDPETGDVDISGGLMIGNCNEMLSFDFAKPSNDLPYLFQVSVKKPDDCNGEKCTYNAYTAKNGIADDKQLSLELPPTLEGFIQCLEETGVFKKGKIQKDKIAALNFSKSFSGAHKTGELWFASHGPEAQARKGVYSKNLAPGKGCYYFEHMKKNPVTLHSLGDVQKTRKYNFFQQVCKYNDYTKIDAQIGSFKGYKDLQRQLINIRNKKIKETMKELHSALNSTKDYSKFNPDTFKQVTNDYLRYIVKPKIAELDKLYNAFVRANGNQKKALLKKLNQASGELLSLVKAPYINSSDYNKMKSFEFKSPLDQENWRDALYAIYQASNAAFHYGKSFNEKFRNKHGGELKSTVALKQDIRGDIKAEKELITDLGRLASNPDKSFYRENMGNAVQLNQLAEEATRDLNLIRQGRLPSNCSHLQSPFLTPNRYSINACMMDEAEFLMSDLTYYNSERDRFLQKAQYWKGIEETIPGRTSRNFNFTPGQRTNPQDMHLMMGPNGTAIDPMDYRMLQLSRMNGSHHGHQMPSRISGIPTQGVGSQFNFSVPQHFNQSRGPAGVQPRMAMPGWQTGAMRYHQGPQYDYRFQRSFF